jgi:hypothetical protein
LMRGLDVGLFGARVEGGEPPLADTGHLSLPLEDRSGEEQRVWYRSPLAAYELARDTLGPYHSADQARRVSPETGAEDITYAAAFEVGRLLCAADGRAASALLEWRRTAYREAGRGRTLDHVAAALTMNPALITLLPQAPAPVLAVAALERAVSASVRRADASGLAAATPGRVLGLDPEALADAWLLTSRADAEQLLSPRPVSAPAPITRPRRSPSVVAPTASDRARLADLRDRLLDSDAPRSGTSPGEGEPR